MKIDLHTHSTFSDGTDSPGELVAKAARAGLDVVALTDHDTTVGWDPALAAANHHEITLIRGIELSVRDAGKGQHLLAYGFDQHHPDLVEMLRRGDESRRQRVPAILDRLREQDVDLELDEVTRHASDTGSVGRPHIAAALVAGGHAEDREDAFRRYLTPGARAFFVTYSPPIAEAIAVIAAAGGVTVIAHPRGRRGELGDTRLAELKNAGLTGIEVDHQEHDGPTRAALRQLAHDLDLVVTGSSDYHGTNKTDHDLGCNLTAPDQFERLLSYAR